MTVLAEEYYGFDFFLALFDFFLAFSKKDLSSLSPSMAWLLDCLYCRAARHKPVVLQT
jgi:hypothetical protein